MRLARNISGQEKTVSIDFVELLYLFTNAPEGEKTPKKKFW